MADIIKVTPEELQSTSSEFASINSQVQNTTSEMVSLINSLNGEVWSGEAQSTFLGKLTGLQNDMTKIHSMINEHVNDLNEMAQTYLSAESANQDIASGLQTGILS